MIRNTENRTKLEEAIPLDSPLVCHVEVTNLCNFKCQFCDSSSSPYYKKFDKGFMDYSLYCKVIDELTEFPHVPKQLSFHFYGEPLLHPRIADMIAYAKKAFSNRETNCRLVLVTNGSRLTPELSRSIVDAGIDFIQISVEHINTEGYKKIAGVDLDYDKLLANVGYLCAYKKDRCEVSAKILDVGLTDEEKNKFFVDFQNITDDCHIEALVQTVAPELMDTTLGYGKDTTSDGYEVSLKNVCTLPFYVMSIYYDGLVSPCVCDWTKTVIIGDVGTQTLQEIWNGKKMLEIRKLQLTGKQKHPVCGKCPAVNNQIDNIDDYAEILLKRIEKQGLREGNNNE